MLLHFRCGLVKIDLSDCSDFQQAIDIASPTLNVLNYLLTLSFTRNLLCAQGYMYKQIYCFQYLFHFICNSTSFKGIYYRGYFIEHLQSWLSVLQQYPLPLVNVKASSDFRSHWTYYSLRKKLQSYVLAKSIYIVNMFAKVEKIIQYTILCILLPYVIIGFQKAKSYQNLVCY